MTHEYRRQLDNDFWAFLSEDENWKGHTSRELRKRHGKRVAAISRELLIDPRTGRTKPEHLDNPDKAFQELKASLKRELNVAAEDAPTPPRSRGRAATESPPG